MATVTTYPADNVVIAAVTTTAGIDSAYVLSSATGYPTKWAGTTANGANVGGTAVLHVFYDWDGTNGARFTVNGTTPTSAVGHLISKGAAATSTELIIVGQSKIAAFQTIGTGSGIKISWYIEVNNDR
jgi:hypothetical protein